MDGRQDFAAGQMRVDKPHAAGDEVQVGEQSIQLRDVMRLLKRTMKLFRTVDKKVDQLDGRLAPLEEFVREAKGKAAEVEEAEAQGEVAEVESQGKGKRRKTNKSVRKSKNRKPSEVE
ncbi:hypothetical protein Bca52824_026917 [Brassica carinata]|uniref:Uncharacterized protein n=1 Tax=Brassica carinata TaxID=52824 RepID=A0A8X7V991_BRACI|nr:hypothetical protein Bca52824_026917 [Brassica carinata]